MFAQIFLLLQLKRDYMLNFSRGVLLYMEPKICLAPGPFKLESLDNFCSFKALNTTSSKSKSQWVAKKKQKSVFLENLFFELFADV